MGPRCESTLVHTMELDFGFIHRLDVPSSGLVLGGTNLEGLFQLKWQIAVYSIDRQYFTANHALFPVPRRVVDERIDASTAENLRSMTDSSGKPARTCLRSLAHFQLRDCSASFSSAVALCVLAIAIHTGRRHQIRAHTRCLGHPTTADARYA